MMERKVAFSLVFMLLFALPTYTAMADESTAVDAFGDGFERGHAVGSKDRPIRVEKFRNSTRGVRSLSLCHWVGGV